jgi:pimeloyl-ACP methyl ester carboxylesterase
MINSAAGGHGRSQLVFLHGGSGSWQLGTEMLQALSGTARWWGLDLPGHGASSWSPGGYALEDVADALADWAADNLDGPAWWYGHSFGGQVALALAGRHPRLVTGLAIGDPPLSATRMQALLTHTGSRLRQWQLWCGRPEPELLELLGSESMGNVTYAEMLGAKHPYLVRMAAALHRHDPAFIDAVVGEPAKVYGGLDGAAAWLAAVDGPVRLFRADPAVLALSHDEDEALVRAHAHDGAAITFAGVGHGLQNFAPDVVADAIAQLIRA